MIGNGLALRYALKQVQAGEIGRLRLGLGVAFLMEMAAIGLLVYDFSQLTFDWQVNAYGSLFWIIGGFLILVLIIGAGMNIFTQAWAWKGIYGPERFVPVENTAVFWGAMIAVWLITVGVLYLVPYRF